MNLPENLYYTKDHEWISVEGDVGTVGITDFAQSELGDIVYLEIESQDEELNAEDVFGTVEAVKTVSDLFMPVSGTVSEFNSDLESSPEIVNEDPYEMHNLLMHDDPHPRLDELQQRLIAASRQHDDPVQDCIGKWFGQWRNTSGHPDVSSMYVTKG